MGCEIIAIIVVGGGLLGGAVWVEFTFLAPLLSWIAGFNVLHGHLFGQGTNQLICQSGTTGFVIVNILGVIWLLSTICWILGFPATVISLLAVFSEDGLRRTGILLAVTVISFIICGLLLRLASPYACI